MTTVPANRRCPTGDVDRFLAIGLDATVRPPRLVIITFRRPVDRLSDGDFRPTAYTITLEAQFVPTLIERMQQALQEHQGLAG